MLTGKIVKIIKSSKDTYWYADKIGQEFPVAGELDNGQYVLIQSYDKVVWLPTKKFIDADDVEVLSYVSYQTLFSAEHHFNP
jgi:NAD(P)H-flavin reductase